MKNALVLDRLIQSESIFVLTLFLEQWFYSACLIAAVLFLVKQRCLFEGVFQRFGLGGICIGSNLNRID